jgi:hypothetical protein
MDPDHRTLLEKISRSLDTLVAAAPIAQPTDNPEARLRDVGKKLVEMSIELAVAHENCRGWHKRATDAEAQLATKRQQSITTHEDISYWKFLATEKADFLRESKLEVVRLTSENRRLTNQVARIITDHDTATDRAAKAEVKVRTLEKLVEELTKSDFGKLHAKYEGGLARLRKRIVVLNSRVGYWKRKKS